MLPSASDLIYFLKMATELHLSLAAKKLNVSQPTLSLALKRLEKLIDTRLFIRHKQGVTLTRAGEALYKEAQTLLLQWEKIEAVIKNANQCAKGRVTIGCHSTLAPFMSKMVAQLIYQYPQLEIHFQHELTEKIMKQIVNGVWEIGLVTDPYPHSDVILQQIAYTEFTFWESKHHSYNLYDPETIIICDPQLSPTQFLIQQLLKLTSHKQLRLSTMNQIEAIANMTVEGYGVSILPSNFTQRYFSDKLKKISSAPLYKKPLYLTFLPENKKIVAIQIVLDAIRALAETENIKTEDTR